jgi:hypothetical protein
MAIPAALRVQALGASRRDRERLHRAAQELLSSEGWRVSVTLPHEGSVVDDMSSTGPHSVEGAGADSSMDCDRVDDPLVGR